VGLLYLQGIIVALGAGGDAGAGVGTPAILSAHGIITRLLNMISSMDLWGYSDEREHEGLNQKLCQDDYTGTSIAWPAFLAR
jgi:hypothetical protein